MQRNALKVLSIDPGTTNLGWVWMEDYKVLKAGNDFLWRQTDRKHRIRVPLVQATAAWVRSNIDMVEEADKILIESQFHKRGAMATFHPMIVMDSMFGACEVLFPGKTDLCHPQAVKTRFNIRGTYEERKAEVSRRFSEFLPTEVRNRNHDACDAMINAWWWLERNGVPRLEEADTSPDAEALREVLRTQFPLKKKKKKAKRKAF